MKVHSAHMSSPTELSCCNVVIELLELIEDSDIDFGYISETWFHADKNDITALAQDKGYLSRHVRRQNREKELGGGVGIVIKIARAIYEQGGKKYNQFFE